jgi:hypothetical protein
MSWPIVTASCIAIIAGMELAKMALVIGGLGRMLIAFVDDE